MAAFVCNFCSNGLDSAEAQDLHEQVCEKKFLHARELRDLIDRMLEQDYGRRVLAEVGADVLRDALGTPAAQHKTEDILRAFRLLSDVLGLPREETH